MAFVQQNSGASATVSSLQVSFAAKTTPGNVLIAGVCCDTSAPTSVTSPEGTWTQAPNSTADFVTNFLGLYAFYWVGCGNTTGPVTLSFGGANTCSLSITEFSEIELINALLGTGTAGTGFGTAALSGAFTPQEAHALLIGVAGGTAAATFTPGTNYTEATDSGGGRPTEVEYREVTSSASYTAASTVSTSTNWGQLLLAFRYKNPGFYTAPMFPYGSVQRQRVRT